MVSYNAIPLEANYYTFIGENYQSRYQNCTFPICMQNFLIIETR